jgi:hypothetical protein
MSDGGVKSEGIPSALADAVELLVRVVIVPAVGTWLEFPKNMLYAIKAIPARNITPMQMLAVRSSSSIVFDSPSIISA